MASQITSNANEKNAASLYVPQACRGLACLMVALFHGTTLVERWYGITPLQEIYNFGFFGVHLFFVISGFIIYYVHSADSENHKNLLTYFAKRIIRIYPLYWIVFFVWGGWRVLFGKFDTHDFISNALLFWSDKKLVVPVAWTLAHELVFYFIFAIFIVNRKLGYAIVAAWFIILLVNHEYGLSNALPLRLVNVLFMLGLAASMILIEAGKKISREKQDLIGFFCLIFGSTLFVTTTLYCRYLSRTVSLQDMLGSVMITFGFGVSSALILLSSLSRKVEIWIKKQNSVMLIGNASYSIYLVHFFIQRIAFNLTRPIDIIWLNKSQGMANLLLFFVMLAPIIAGIIIHKAIEKPMLVNFRKLLKRV